MAAHNEEEYVRSAVESVLGQSLPHFELLIIDDASTDNTASILADFHDPRIRIFRNEKCQGLTRSLIKGMAEARGAFIARLDADDLAMPERLEKQLAEFRNTPALGLVGSNCWMIDANGNRIGSRRMPPTDLAIRWRSIIDAPFLHPAIMFRVEAYKEAGGYDPSIEVEAAEDFDLWTRMLRVTQARNLSSKLIAYRMRRGSVSDRNRQRQLTSHDRIMQRTLAELMPGHGISTESLQLLRALYAGGSPPVPPDAIAPLVMEYWSLLQAFYVKHTDMPGWGPLVRYEWMRGVRRLLRAPRGRTTRQAWRTICTPKLACARP